MANPLWLPFAKLCKNKFQLFSEQDEMKRRLMIENFFHLDITGKNGGKVFFFTVFMPIFSETTTNKQLSAFDSSYN